MADRFAELATGNNNWSSVNTWKATTDGATGASVPTSSDNVYINADSCAAGATLTVDATANCLAMDWSGGDRSGATNTPTFTQTNKLYVYGDLTTIAAMVYGGSQYLYFAGNIAHNLTSNGLTINNVGVYLGSGFIGTINLLDALTTNRLRIIAGTITTNNHDVTCALHFSLGQIGAATANLGSSTINTVEWQVYAGPVTLNAGTSIINASGNFTGGSIATYNIVNLTGATSTITGNNTFATFALPPATTQTIIFTDGTTQTATTFTLDGSAGHIHTLQGTGVAGWALVQA